MKSVIMIIAGCILFSVGGCSVVSAPNDLPDEQVTGVQIRDEQLLGLKDRYSTTLAVFNRLGPPSRKIETGQSEQWSYDYHRSYRSQPQRSVSESMVFDFGRDGVMTAHKRITLMTP